MDNVPVTINGDNITNDLKSINKSQIIISTLINYHHNQCHEIFITYFDLLNDIWPHCFSMYKYTNYLSTFIVMYIVSML